MTIPEINEQWRRMMNSRNPSDPVFRYSLSVIRGGKTLPPSMFGDDWDALYRKGKEWMRLKTCEGIVIA